MELALLVYFAGIVGGLKELLAVYTVVGLVITGFVKLNASMDRTKVKIKTWIVVTITASAILCVIIPSQKTLYLMAGGYVSQQALTSETAGKVVQIVNSKLDEYLEEAEKAVKK